MSTSSGDRSGGSRVSDTLKLHDEILRLSALAQTRLEEGKQEEAMALFEQILAVDNDKMATIPTAAEVSKARKEMPAQLQAVNKTIAHGTRRAAAPASGSTSSKPPPDLRSRPSHAVESQVAFPVRRVLAPRCTGPALTRFTTMFVLPLALALLFALQASGFMDIIRSSGGPWPEAKCVLAGPATVEVTGRGTWVVEASKLTASYGIKRYRANVPVVMRLAHGEVVHAVAHRWGHPAVSDTDPGRLSEWLRDYVGSSDGHTEVDFPCWYDPLQPTHVRLSDADPPDLGAYRFSMLLAEALMLCCALLSCAVWPMGLRDDCAALCAPAREGSYHLV